MYSISTLRQGISLHALKNGQLKTKHRSNKLSSSMGSPSTVFTKMISFNYNVQRSKYEIMGLTFMYRCADWQIKRSAKLERRQRKRARGLIGCSLVR